MPLITHLSSSKTKEFAGTVELKASCLPIKAVIVQQLATTESQENKSLKIYMSTDVEQDPAQLITCYRSRFQQEFIFRDAKQFAGLDEGQARNWVKIDSHVSVAMTVVNLAKAAHHLSTPAADRGAFSMSDITTAYANERLALRIFSECGIDPNQPEMKTVLRNIRNYTARAA